MQDLKCETTKEFSINVDGVDELWAEILGTESPSNIKRLICCAYRHPLQKKLEYFFNNLNNCLLTLEGPNALIDALNFYMPINF